MNSHVQIDTQSATPVTIKAAPSLSQLLQAHQKITDPISMVPSGVGANNLRETAEELLYDITQARAATWEEFGRKVQILVDQTTEASHEGWLRRLLGSEAVERRGGKGLIGSLRLVATARSSVGAGFYFLCASPFRIEVRN
ncbi:hypothetical protein [Bradyrhizobium japonicum]|uniref:hypothetical protein n=1 Tax=Bradyrhizobium japonicum TaxID=375 RepID=UPI003399258C